MKFLPTIFVTVAILGALLPSSLFAQQPSPVVPASPQPSPVEDGNSRELTNPLSGIDSLEDLLVALLRVVVVLATPIVVLFIILAGFKYVTARGDVAKTKEATVALTYAIIGGVLIIGAVAIAEIIGNLVTAFSS